MEFIKRHVDQSIVAFTSLSVVLITGSLVTQPSVLAGGFAVLGGLTGMLAAAFVFDLHLQHKAAEARKKYAEASPAGIRMMMAHSDSGKKESPIYCKDCGQKYTIWSRQSGFNPQTGQPNMISFNACPDWSQVRTDAKMAAYWSRLAGFGALNSGEPPAPDYTCGNAVATDPTSQAHTSHPYGDVNPSCPGCLEQMVADGIITREQANSRTS